MKLAPLDMWRGSEKTASSWNETINSHQAHTAIALALADYQREVAHLPDGAAMLRGANGIIDRLLNMGEPKRAPSRPSFQLPQPDTIEQYIKQ